MTDQIASFIDHMRANDCGPENPHDIIADDKRPRSRLAGDQPKTQNASYQLTLARDGLAAGWGHPSKQAITPAPPRNSPPTPTPAPPSTDTWLAVAASSATTFVKAAATAPPRHPASTSAAPCPMALPSPNSTTS